MEVHHPNPLDLSKRVIFSDGSCFFPKDRQFSIKGAAVTMAVYDSHNHQTTDRRIVPGADHTLHRAEIFGVILALQVGHVGDIWCDCASVIGDLKAMLFYLQNGTSWIPPDHCDLGNCI